MKFLKKFNIFEREMSKKWVAKNPDFYLMKNKNAIEAEKQFVKKTVDSSELLKHIREHLKNVSINDISVNIYSVRGDVYLKKSYTESISDILLEYATATNSFLPIKMEFLIERDMHRLHTANGLDERLRGIGLGYKMYKAIINELGYARSSYFSTNKDSRKIWYHLIQDDDYYSIILNKGITELKDKSFLHDKNAKFPDATKELEGVLIISKKLPLEEIKKLVIECMDKFKTVELDKKIKRIYEIH